MKFFMKLVFFILLVGGGYFVYKFYFAENQKIAYETINPTRGDVINSIEAVGEVFAVDMVDVGAEVSGQIKKLYVKVGDKVKKGDKIADIDDVKQSNEVKRLEAGLGIYKARLRSKTISLDVANKEYAREKALYKRGATSKESLEKAKNISVSQSADLEEIKANIIQTNIALSSAKTDLAYTKIISPINGTILSTPTKEGQTVNARQSTPNIAIVADLSKMEIKMQIAEGDITKVKVGQKILFNTLSDSKKFQATLSSIDPAYTRVSDNLSTTSSSAAVYYYAKFIAPNEKGILRIGMTTQNSIIIEEKKDVLRLPISTIGHDKDITFIYILKNNNPIKQNVEVGISDGINIEIKSPLKEDEDVLTYPLLDKAQGDKRKKARIRVR